MARLARSGQRVETSPVTYTSFGEGEKPLMLGSLPRSRPQDWVQVSEKIWATLPMEYQVSPPVANAILVDVGNIIFDEGAVCGWKKWSLDEFRRNPTTTSTSGPRSGSISTARQPRRRGTAASSWPWPGTSSTRAASIT